MCSTLQCTELYSSCLIILLWVRCGGKYAGLDSQLRTGAVVLRTELELPPSLSVCLPLSSARTGSYLAARHRAQAHNIYPDSWKKQGFRTKSHLYRPLKPLENSRLTINPSPVQWEEGGREIPTPGSWLTVGWDCPYCLY